MPAKRTESTTSKAPAARKRAVRRKPTSPSEEEIATRAYYLHLEGGHDPFENWLRAERELAAA
ncbi:MAG TPA: DUF2934 domain-containing protein [Gaiellaceae bacterium]|nr:DUF2934 domain-containing protein [Gaiellaceae bacterium]